MTGHINDVIELPSLMVKTSKVKYWWFHFQQADRQSNWGWNFSFSFWFDFDGATLASNVQSAQWTGEIDTLPLLLTWYCLWWFWIYWSEIAPMVTWANKQKSRNLSPAKTEGKPIVSICFWPFCPALPQLGRSWFQFTPSDWVSWLWLCTSDHTFYYWDISYLDKCICQFG